MLITILIQHGLKKECGFEYTICVGEHQIEHKQIGTQYIDQTIGNVPQVLLTTRCVLFGMNELVQASRVYTKAIKTELTDQNQPPTAITEGIDRGGWKKKKKKRKKERSRTPIIMCSLAVN